MNPSLQQTCELLVDNKRIFSEAFRWSNDTMNLAAAFLFTAAGRRADPAALSEAEQILKGETGALSVFRGHIKVPLLCKMALSGRPKAFLAQTVMLYERLNLSKWQSNEYKALAAAILCAGGGEGDADNLVLRTREIYDLMKAQHPWLTTGEDMVYAAILAVSGLNVEELAAEAERNYVILKGSFRSRNAVQSLSHVLAPGEAPAEEKCARVIRLFEGLKKAGCKYGSSYQLSILGLLALLDVPEEQLIQEICEAEAFLKPQKGFGNFSIGREMRLMSAAQIVLLQHAPASDKSAELVPVSLLSFTVAMEAAMVAVMVSMMAAATTMTTINT